MKEYLTNSNNRKYTTAISKGAAMVDETRQLLESWHPGESLDDFAKRVQNDGILGNSTAYRTKDIVRRVFATRLLKPDDKPARLLKNMLESSITGRTFTEILFLYAARQDPLVYDFTVREYWPIFRRGRTSIDTDNVRMFLSEAMVDGRLDNQWSDNVTVRIARCVLGLLRDIGFIREYSRGQREMTDYRMSDEGIAILARELHESGCSDSTLCSHPDWGLFGMTKPETIERLDSIGEHRGLIVQSAGSVIRITWSIKSIEELINVLAGRYI